MTAGTAGAAIGTLIAPGIDTIIGGAIGDIIGGAAGYMGRFCRRRLAQITRLRHTHPMDDNSILWIEHHASALPFRPGGMEKPPEPLHALIDCGAQGQLRRWRLDWPQLGECERTWIEGGEYLPALACLWLAQAATLMHMCAQQAQAAAVLHVPSRRLIQLSISDLLHAMGSDAWLADAQIALVWGFAHDALMQPHAPRHPLPCRGAVFPCGDGLDIGWWALPADIRLISHPA